jgi:homoserine O-succinyltransferase/O-acetyltransferase
MTLLFDKYRPIDSPALVPAHDETVQRADHRAELTIGLINNIPDSALKATERQFSRILQAAATSVCVRLHCFTLLSVRRSPEARWHIDREYSDIADLGRLPIDGLIVTGAEPVAERLPEEPYWRELTELIDWAKSNTRSTIWSCLAAHAAVLHLDGIERHRLAAKCSGIFDCRAATEHWLTRGAPRPLRVSHSRLNELRDSELADCGYQILTRSDEAGVDIFARQVQSRFIFLQGHPEYDALSLQREYMRDVARFLSGERDDYPPLPAAYFDAATEQVLADFERRAKAKRDPTLAAELPGLTLRPDIAAGAAATVLCRNWVGFLAKGAKAELRARRDRERAR